MASTHRRDEAVTVFLVGLDSRLNQLAMGIEPLEPARLAVAVTRLVHHVELVATVQRNVTHSEVLPTQLPN